MLKLVGARDPAVFDVITADASTQNILHGLTRQLVSYPSGKQFSDVVGRVVADAATQVPLPVDGTSYTFTLRDGVAWDVPTPRAVTSADFARGIKRQCNPVAGGFYASYFTATIAGLADFCSGLGALTANATAAQLRAYVETHPVAGLATPDDRTLVVTLTAPAGDFLNMMALTAASAVPIESLDYLPGTAAQRAHFVSDGPYAVQAYTAGTSMTLTRNPAWVQASDSVRKAYVDEVDIAFGRTEAQAQAQIDAGTVDFTTDLFTPADRAADTPAVLTPGAPTTPGPPPVESVTDGSSSYLAFNLTSPVSALRTTEVRQALALATDKNAVVQVSGGPRVVQTLGTILTPQILGFRPAPGPGNARDAGDPAAAKRALAAAGYPSGMPLRLAYPTSGSAPQVAQAIRQAWEAAGVTVVLTPTDPDALRTPLNRRGRGAPSWDVALSRWSPTWYGNAARTFFSMLIRSGAPGNVGHYSNPAVDGLISQALAEPDPNRAADIWAQADAATMADPPWVPLFTGRSSFSQSTRVRGWAWDGLAMPDYTQVWLQAP